MSQPHIQQPLHLLAARWIQRCALQQGAELCQGRKGRCLAGVDHRDAEVWWGRGGFLNWGVGLVDVEYDAEGGVGVEGISLRGGDWVVPGYQGQFLVNVNCEVG